MKKIRMLISDDRLGLKAGEIYEVTPYCFDDKLTLVRRVPDGYDPECNIYCESECDAWEYVKEETK